MKDRVYKSRGIVTLITDALTKIKSTEPLRLVKQTVCRKKKHVFCLLKKRNWREILLLHWIKKDEWGKNEKCHSRNYDTCFYCIDKASAKLEILYNIWVSVWWKTKSSIELFIIVVYHESIKRGLQRRLMYWYRWDERLKTKSEESTCLSDTGLVVELEHLRTKTRLKDEVKRLWVTGLLQEV